MCLRKDSQDSVNPGLNLNVQHRRPKICQTSPVRRPGMRLSGKVVSEPGQRMTSLQALPQVNTSQGLEVKASS